MKSGTVELNVKFLKDIAKQKEVDYKKERTKDRTLWNTRTVRGWMRGK